MFNNCLIHHNKTFSLIIGEIFAIYVEQKRADARPDITIWQYLKLCIKDYLNP